MQKIKIHRKKHNPDKVGISIFADQIAFTVFSVEQKQIVDEGCFRNEDPLKSLEKIRARIKNDSHCYLVLPNHIATIKRYHFVDSFTSKKFSRLVKLNAHKYFSCPIDSVYYDYECLNHTPGYIRIAGCKKDSINPWIKLFERVALNLSLVTFDVLALENFFRLSNLLAPDLVYAIFLQLANVGIQVIMDAGLVIFINNIVFDNIDINFCDQLNHFVQLYEASVTDPKPVDEAIIVSAEFAEDNLHCYPKIRSAKTLFPNLKATSLLSYGAII